MAFAMLKIRLMKTASFAVAAVAASLSPVHAQDVVQDAMEAASEAAELAAENAIDRPSQTTAQADNTSPPQLIEFNLLQNKPADYPPASWIAGEEGTVYYELTVGEDGNVRACDIIDSSGFAALDAKTCEIAFDRGQFSAATDEEGNPVAGVHRDFQVWTKREPQFAGTSRIHVQYTLTAQGEVTDCEAVEITGNIGASMRDTMENEPCPGMNRANAPIYRDAAGNPVAKRVDLIIAVEVEDVPE